MKKISLEESKKLILDILIYFDQFCNQHGIKYSLAYGTLIGAIRHKGFIPWDDDIDIIMMRNDYDKFIRLYHDSRYEIVDGARQTNHAHIRISDTYTKVKFSSDWRGHFYDAGLWIDIFPIDYVPDTLKGYNWFRKRVWLLFELQLIGEIKRPNTLLGIAHYVCKPFSSFFGRKAQKRMLKYNNKQTLSVADLGSWYQKINPSFPAIFMHDYIDVEFEGYMFKVIKEYDKLLSLLYGDYMQFPPKGDQVPHHDFEAYMKED